MKQPMTFATLLLSISFFVCSSATAAARAVDPLSEWKNIFDNAVLILMDDASRPGDGENVAAEINNLGGGAAVVLDREAVIGWVPSRAAGSALRQLPHVRNVVFDMGPLPIDDTHRHARAAILYFQAAKSGKLLRDLIDLQQLPPFPEIPDVLTPNTRMSGTGATSKPSDATGSDRLDRLAPGLATSFNPRVTQQLNGRIHSSLFFAQCSGSPDCRFTWTAADIDDVTNRFISGYQYWTDAGSRYGKALTFTIRTFSPLYANQLNVPLEPVLTQIEQQWITPIMNNFGYPGTNEFSVVRAYTDAVVNGNGGVYTAAVANFIADNAGSPTGSPYSRFGGIGGLTSYAYIGEFAVLLSDPDGSRPYLTAVVPHETGHLFYACDEYRGSHCTGCAVCTGANGYRPPGTNVPNLNCIGDNYEYCVSVVSCIMNDIQTAFNSRSICSYTAQHVGWPANACFHSVPSTHWSATYYNDPYDAISGTWQHFTSPVSRNDEGTGFLAKDWGLGSPTLQPCVVNSDHFSAYYATYPSFSEGVHTFTVTADDGVRVVVDSTMVIDKLIDQPPTTYTGDVYLVAGTHLVKVYYYEATGGATLHVSWN